MAWRRRSLRQIKGTAGWRRIEAGACWRSGVDQPGEHLARPHGVAGGHQQLLDHARARRRQLSGCCLMLRFALLDERKRLAMAGPAGACTCICGAAW